MIQVATMEAQETKAVADECQDIPQPSRELAVRTKRRAPGSCGNQNATRHGVFGYLAVGTLPKGASWIRRLVGQFRRETERAVMANEGELSLYHAALVQSAARHEARALLLSRWLKQEAAAKLADRVAVLKEIGAATNSRDHSLRQLGLNKTARGNIIEALYGPGKGPADADDPDDRPTDQGAAGATPAAHD
jgi:hypothetical protein